MPPDLTPQGPAVSLKGPRSLLDDATDGSVGSAFQTDQSAASLAVSVVQALIAKEHAVCG